MHAHIRTIPRLAPVTIAYRRLRVSFIDPRRSAATISVPDDESTGFVEDTDFAERM